MRSKLPRLTSRIWMPFPGSLSGGCARGHRARPSNQVRHGGKAMSCLISIGCAHCGPTQLTLHLLKGKLAMESPVENWGPPAHARSAGLLDQFNHRMLLQTRPSYVAGQISGSPAGLKSESWSSTRRLLLKKPNIPCWRATAGNRPPLTGRFRRIGSFRQYCSWGRFRPWSGGPRGSSRIRDGCHS